MKRIAVALASASLLAASGGLALAASPTSDTSGASPPNAAPQNMQHMGTMPMHSMAAPSATSGSTQAQGPRHRRMAAAKEHDEDTPEGQRITKALNALEASGYGDFTNFEASGGNFTATVTKDGRQMKVTVDPDTGQVMPLQG